MTRNTNAREAILNTAEKLIVEQGVKQFSFGSLAKAAEISRGGILYHFASKEILIQAMIQRLIERFEAILADEMANDSEEQGRFTRAFARATFRMDAETTSVFSAIIAATAYDIHLLDPLQQKWDKWREQSENELEKPVAAVVQLTSYALWLGNIFGVNRYTQDEQIAIVKILDNMTRS